MQLIASISFKAKRTTTHEIITYLKTLPQKKIIAQAIPRKHFNLP
jgi:hypothetical protein